MVPDSGRPEDGTSLVPGFGCSGGVFGACGFVVCVRALGWSDSVVSPPLCWVLGLGPGGVSAWLAGWQDLTKGSSSRYDHMHMII